MTANGLIRKLQNEVNQLNSGEIPIVIDGKEVVGMEVELLEGGRAGYYIRIKPIF